jgi:hypothetical protein
MSLFWILWIFSAIMALVPLYFFFVGLTDGSVTIRNISLWLIMLLIIGGVLAGSYWLNTHQYPGYAKGLLLVTAIPGMLGILYFLVVIIAKPKWN